MVVQKIKNGNNFYYFHFIDSHTVVKNHSNLMASVRVFRDEPSFFTSDDANIQQPISFVKNYLVLCLHLPNLYCFPILQLLLHF